MLLMGALRALINRPGWNICLTSFLLFPVAFTASEAWSLASVVSLVAYFTLIGPDTGEPRGLAESHDKSHCIIFDIS